MHGKEAIVTGANGFLGARVALELLDKGWTVHALGRDRHETAWNDRLLDALWDIEGKPVPPERLTGLRSHAADLTAPGLGLSDATISEITAGRPVIMHLAADTNFNPRDPERQRKINTSAPLNVLEALGGAAERFVHVSTAYVAGRREGRILEEPFDDSAGFHNSYEQSKWAGETAVRRHCEQAGVPLAVARPAIVVNDSRTGRSSTLTHLNALVEMIARIQAHFGPAFGEAGDVVRVTAGPDARPALIAVDAVVRALIRIAESDESPGKTYHLCPVAPRRTAETIDHLVEAFGVKGKVEIRYVRDLPGPVIYTERMILRAFGPYMPYLNSRADFDFTHTRELIGDYDTLAGPLDGPFFHRVAMFQYGRVAGQADDPQARRRSP